MIGNDKFTPYHSCIVIGEGLTVKYNYHLLIDRNGVKIDKVMTIEEHEMLMQIFKALGEFNLV